MNEFKTHLISYIQVRQAIGFLAIGLPIVLAIDSKIYNNPLENSISAYYYTNLGDVFVGMLCAISMFLFTYKGYEKDDNIITNIAAITALGIALFPTDGRMSCVKLGGGVLSDMAIHYVHVSCAAIFFFTLAIYSIFYFTKTDNESEKTAEKKVRNVIYISCGVIILLCMVIMVYCVFTHASIFWEEAIALFAFGTSWIIKGELFLEDAKRLA